MASTKDYLQFILEQLSETEEISYRAMMGEYVLYCRRKVVGGIYDDRLLVKPTPSAVRLMPDASYDTPYLGGKPMLAVERLEDKAFLRELFTAIAKEI